MTNEITPFFALAMTLALILNWLKIDEKSITLFTHFMIVGSIQLYSALIYSYEPLVRFVLLTISIGSILIALIAILGGYSVYGFFAIEPIIYASLTKDTYLMIKWKRNKA